RMHAVLRGHPRAVDPEPVPRQRAEISFRHLAAARVARTQNQNTGSAHSATLWQVDEVSVKQQQPDGRVQRHAATATTAPATGPTRYNHRSCTCPLTTAGATDRAGFIDAPEIVPANIASSATTAPIAAPAMIPVSRLPVETFRMTYIRSIVRTA